MTTVIPVLELVANGTLLLIFGVIITVNFAEYEKTVGNKRAIALFIVMILFLQLTSYYFFGLEVTSKLYPLITHFPVVVFIVFYLKRPLPTAIVSVLIAYLCCQPSRWIGLAAQFLWGSKEAFFLGNSLGMLLLLYLIEKYAAPSVSKVMAYSRRTLYLFGSFPLLYYLFDYVATVYTGFLYSGTIIVAEFLPSVVSLFYIVFVMVYYHEMQKRSRLELDNVILETQSERAMNQILALQQVQSQTAIYRHDMRHHLSLLYGFIELGEPERALNYIKQTLKDIDAIVPGRYCENNTVNLILSFFAARARQKGVTFDVDAVMPDHLEIPDTEICALLSNGLQNAIDAASSEPPANAAGVRVKCWLHKGNLLLLIENTFHGPVKMKQGLPQADEEGHGFGVKSITMIVDKYKGYYSFSHGEGLFTLKLVLPLER